MSIVEEIMFSSLDNYETTKRNAVLCVSGDLDLDLDVLDSLQLLFLFEQYFRYFVMLNIYYNAIKT